MILWSIVRDSCCLRCSPGGLAPRAPAEARRPLPASGVPSDARVAPRRLRTARANPKRGCHAPCRGSRRVTPHASPVTSMPGGETPPETPRPPTAGDRGVFCPCEATPVTNSRPAPLRPLTKRSRGAAQSCRSTRAWLRHPSSGRARAAGRRRLPRVLQGRAGHRARRHRRRPAGAKGLRSRSGSAPAPGSRTFLAAHPACPRHARGPGCASREFCRRGMSFISAIRPQAIEDARENWSGYGGCASARRFTGMLAMIR
jgi:hypothetical protein